MTEVFIDGELVEFTGSPPATVGELRSLAEQTVAGAGRVLARIVIDGADGGTVDPGQALAACNRIDMTTVGAGEALASVAAAAVAGAREARTTATGLMQTVLRLPWPEARSSCGELTEKLGRVLEGAVAVAMHAGPGPAAAAVENLSSALEVWMNAVENGDAAAVCLRTEDALLPALGSVEGALVAAAGPMIS